MKALNFIYVSKFLLIVLIITFPVYVFLSWMLIGPVFNTKFIGPYLRGPSLENDGICWARASKFKSMRDIAAVKTHLHFLLLEYTTLAYVEELVTVSPI